MKRVFAASLVVMALGAASFATGCVGMTPAEQRALSGGAIGAATGALIGSATGNAGAGAAIGGAAGATGGYIYERNRETRDERGY